MSKSTVKVRVETDKMDKVKESLKSEKRAKIGLIGDQPEGLVSIAYKQEFGVGSSTDLHKPIPMRSFLRAPILRMSVDEIKRIVEKEWVNLDTKDGLEELLWEIGAIAFVAVQDSFKDGDNGTWKANSPYTVYKKGHDKILYQTGKLQQNIRLEVE